MKKLISFFGILMIFLFSLLYSANALTTVTVTPASPVTTDNLIVTHDGNVSISTITWNKNSVNQSTYDNSTTIPSSATAKGDIWEAFVDESGTILSDSVTIQNSAPVLSLVDQKAHESLSFTYESYASDVDAVDTLTYSYEVVSAPTGSTFSTSNFNTGTGKITWTPEEDDDTGDIELKINVTDGNSTTSDTFTIDVYPDFMCDEGEKGSGLDIKIDEPDNGDNFAPGDKINLEVNVDNDAEDMDVIVEAFLYNVDQNDKVDESESDSVDIDDNDDYDFDSDDSLFLQKIPFDLDFDNGDEFRVYVKAYEDGDEDVYCISDSISIDLEREDNAVIVEKTKLTLSTINPGETTELVVDILNIGDKDQDDVTVMVVRSDLKISQESTRFDLDKFEDSDNDATKRFTLSIPSTTKPGTYSLEVTILDEDGDVYDVNEASIFVDLTIAGEAVSEEASFDLIKTSFEQKQGESFNLPVKVKNSGTSEGTYVIEVSSTGGWADTTTEIISVGAGKETTVYPTLSVKSTAITGSYTAQISLKSLAGSVLDSSTASISIRSKSVTGITGGATYQPANLFNKDLLTNAFWIIGNLALVVIVIYFVKLIFIKPR